MKKGNLKPSLLTYYLTRYSLVHPMLAITQINIAIYLITASPFINKNLITSAAVSFRQFFSLFMLAIIMMCTRKCSHKVQRRDIKYIFILGNYYFNEIRFHWHIHLIVFLTQNHLSNNWRPLLSRYLVGKHFRLINHI